MAKNKNEIDSMEGIVARLVRDEVYTTCSALMEQAHKIDGVSESWEFEYLPDYAMDDRQDAEEKKDEHVEALQDQIDKLTDAIDNASDGSDLDPDDAPRIRKLIKGFEEKIDMLEREQSQAEDEFNDEWHEDRMIENYVVHQYWVVSDYFAERAKEAGLRITEVADLNVWSRFECNDMYKCDEIKRVASVIYRNVNGFSPSENEESNDEP